MHRRLGWQSVAQMRSNFVFPVLSAVSLLALVSCGEGTRAEPEVEAFDEFPGLSAPVEVKIDDRGIPHIYGQTDDDVAYASGYQVATDRLLQLELVKRRALGTQAELLGPDKVNSDLISRTFDFQRWGKLNRERLREEDPEFHNFVVSWVAGVNKRIEDVENGDAPLPPGFSELGAMPTRWEVDDHYAIAKLFYFGNSNSLEREILTTILRDLFPDAYAGMSLEQPMFSAPIVPDDELPGDTGSGGVPRSSLYDPPRPMPPLSEEAALEGFERFHDALSHLPRVGSNNWAVDGRHTDNGRPYIAGDPHQPLDSPSLMYALHLDSKTQGEGRINVAGFQFAGVAGVPLGHNEHVQWTATTNFADVMDMWDVTLTADGQAVEVGGEMVDIEYREEVIEVAGEDDVVVNVGDVPGYGVFVPESLLPLPVVPDDHEVLLNWTGFKATAEERCFFSMMLAEDTEEYDEAVDIMQVGGWNFIAADTDSITYRVNIDVPDRGDPSASQMPFLLLDGNDADSYWTGDFLPAERLPRSHAETDGWIASANNDPWGFTADGDVSNDPFYYGFFYAAGHRAKRLDDEFARLVDAGSIGMDEMQTLQLDTHSVMADALLPVLEEAWAAMDSDEDLAEQFEDVEGMQEVYQLLTSDWNRRMDRDQPGALAFHMWMHLLTLNAIGDDFSLIFPTVMAEEPPFIIKIPGLAMTDQYAAGDALLQEGREQLALQSLLDTVELLEDRFDGWEPENYSWGDMHGTRFDNDVASYVYGWIPTDGGEDTVNVSSSRFFQGMTTTPGERYDSTSGAIYRLVATFSEDGLPQAWMNFAVGNGGNPDDPHWGDEMDRWVSGGYDRLWFTDDEVDEHLESTLTIEE